MSTCFDPTRRWANLLGVVLALLCNAQQAHALCGAVDCCQAADCLQTPDKPGTCGDDGGSCPCCQPDRGQPSRSPENGAPCRPRCCCWIQPVTVQKDHHDVVESLRLICFGGVSEDFYLVAVSPSYGDFGGDDSHRTEMGCPLYVELCRFLI